MAEREIFKFLEDGSIDNKESLQYLLLFDGYDEI